MDENIFVDKMIDFAIKDLKRYKSYRWHVKNDWWLRYNPLIRHVWIMSLWKHSFIDAKQNLEVINIVLTKKVN